MIKKYFIDNGELNQQLKVSFSKFKIFLENLQH